MYLSQSLQLHSRCSSPRDFRHFVWIAKMCGCDSTKDADTFARNANVPHLLRRHEGILVTRPTAISLSRQPGSAVSDNFCVSRHFQQNTSCRSSILFRFSRQNAPSSRYTRALPFRSLFSLRTYVGIEEYLSFSLLIYLS